MKTLFSLAVCILLVLTTGRAQVGVGTVSPNSTMDIRGSLSTSCRAFSSATTINDSDYTIVFTGTGASSATLPTAASCAGRTYVIKNAATGSPVPVLSISTTAAQTIDGQTTWYLDEPNEAIMLTSNGSNWVVNNQSVPVYKSSTTGGAWNEGGNNTPSMKAIGTNSNFDLPFMTNASEKMRITAAGNIGIGTTNPIYKLQVSATADPLYLSGLQNGSGTDSLLAIENGVVKKIAQSAMPAAPTNIWSTIGNSGTSFATNFVGTTDNTSLRFRTNNIQRMMIDSMGNVGIGTAVPGNLIEINSGTSGLSGLRLKQIPEGAVLYANGSGDLVQNTATLYFDAANSRLSIGAGTSPNSALTIGGGMALPVTTKTANYTLTADNYTVLCNSTTGGFTITLPAASGCSGRVYIVKKSSTDGNLNILHASGTDNIDGSTNQYLYAPYAYFTLQSDGTSTWRIIAQH